ncbi:MAG TPA: tetratricopeptide repeat protein [Terracidiphilus sp.]|nr:tetratricopeptide repeat protein [Terracidiphilus sp.]
MPFFFPTFYRASCRASYLASWMSGIAAILLAPAVSLCGQSAACPAVADHVATPAGTAYGEGRYGAAEELYEQALAKTPQDVELSATLVHTLLHEGKVAQASTQANTSLAANPHAAPTLTALAEVQLRQGEPWLALETLDQATATDPCYARIHLIRSRALRIDSMYASERKELESAYDIDPTDSDIQYEWSRVDSPANEIEGTDKALAAQKDIDVETRKRAETTVHAMMPLLFETSQTCQVVPDAPSATLPLKATYADPKHIDGYRLEADFPQGKAKLIVDTAASGLFISKALADLNGFKQGPEDPPGTAHIDSFRVGSLEFRNCLVGVTDGPIAGKADGFIGTDIFASWLITLDYRNAKLILAPLPPQAGDLPGDRAVPPEFADYTPVYHRRQYLLVPLTFGNKSRKLFILATGMRFSAMTSPVAHSLSKMTVNFTNTEQTANGGKAQFYREVFDIQMASLPQIHQGHILELDPTVIDRNAGFEIAGMLGLDVLQPLTLHLDYRDGLVKFETTEESVKPLFGKGTMIASKSAAPANQADQPVCQPGDTIARPLSETIEARATGGFDSAHLKPGKEIWVRVISGYVYPGCTLDLDAILYGHVTAASTLKNSSESELSLVFDHADCTGHAKKPLTLRLIGLVAPPDESRRLLHEIPVEVSGGAQQVGGSRTGKDAVSELNNNDDNLNPGGPPRTIHPGIVVRMPDVKLAPEGGRECSAKITSTKNSVTIGTGAELLLSLMVPQ